LPPQQSALSQQPPVAFEHAARTPWHTPLSQSLLQQSSSWAQAMAELSGMQQALVTALQVSPALQSGGLLFLGLQQSRTPLRHFPATHTPVQHPAPHAAPVALHPAQAPAPPQAPQQ
jgi:hypothetical protein